MYTEFKRILVCTHNRVTEITIFDSCNNVKLEEKKKRIVANKKSEKPKLKPEKY